MKRAEKIARFLGIEPLAWCDNGESEWPNPDNWDVMGWYLRCLEEKGYVVTVQLHEKEKYIEIRRIKEVMVWVRGGASGDVEMPQLVARALKELADK